MSLFILLMNTLKNKVKYLNFLMAPLATIPTFKCGRWEICVYRVNIPTDYWSICNYASRNFRYMTFSWEKWKATPCLYLNYEVILTHYDIILSLEDSVGVTGIFKGMLPLSLSLFLCRFSGWVEEGGILNTSLIPWMSNRSKESPKCEPHR